MTKSLLNLKFSNTIIKCSDESNIFNIIPYSYCDVVHADSTHITLYQDNKVIYDRGIKIILDYNGNIINEETPDINNLNDLSKWKNDHDDLFDYENQK